MTFTFEIAKKLVTHYQFLIGYDFNKKIPNAKITHILIAPNDPMQYEKFINKFHQYSDNQIALLDSDIDKLQVRILLVSNDTGSGNIFTDDLDKFLTRMNIEKVYI